VNSYHEAIEFKLPAGVGRWQVRVDTAIGQIDPPDRSFGPDQSVDLEGRALLLLAGAAA
jgi:hypothetical protein